MVRIISQNFSPPRSRHSSGETDWDLAERTKVALSSLGGGKRFEPCEYESSSDSFWDSEFDGEHCESHLLEVGSESQDINGNDSCEKSDVHSKRKERRRERNKLSAQAYRKRRRHQNAKEQQQLLSLESENRRLHKLVETLEKKTEQAKQYLLGCSVPMPDILSPVGEESPEFGEEEDTSQRECETGGATAAYTDHADDSQQQREFVHSHEPCVKPTNEPFKDKYSTFEEHITNEMTIPKLPPMNANLEMKLPNIVNANNEISMAKPSPVNANLEMSLANPPPVNANIDMLLPKPAPVNINTNTTVPKSPSNANENISRFNVFPAQFLTRDSLTQSTQNSQIFLQTHTLIGATVSPQDGTKFSACAIPAYVAVPVENTANYFPNDNLNCNVPLSQSLMSTQSSVNKNVENDQVKQTRLFNPKSTSSNTPTMFSTLKSSSNANINGNSVKVKGNNLVGLIQMEMCNNNAENGNTNINLNADRNGNKNSCDNFNNHVQKKSQSFPPFNLNLNRNTEKSFSRLEAASQRAKCEDRPNDFMQHFMVQHN